MTNLHEFVTCIKMSLYGNITVYCIVHMYVALLAPPFNVVHVYTLKVGVCSIENEVMCGTCMYM